MKYIYKPKLVIFYTIISYHGKPGTHYPHLEPDNDFDDYNLRYILIVVILELLLCNNVRREGCTMKIYAFTPN